MPVTRTYECADCGYRTTVRHERHDEPPPASCPRCDQPDPVRQMSAPHIARPISKAGVDTYRAMEASSQVRAEMVAEQFGESAHETAMGITDLASNLRPGDVAAVTRAPTTPPPSYFQAPAAASEFARSTGSGPVPYAGVTSPHGWNAVRQNHAATAAAMAAAGRIR